MPFDQSPAAAVADAAPGPAPVPPGAYAFAVFRAARVLHMTVARVRPPQPRTRDTVATAFRAFVRAFDPALDATAQTVALRRTLLDEARAAHARTGGTVDARR